MGGGGSRPLLDNVQKKDKKRFFLWMSSLMNTYRSVIPNQTQPLMRNRRGGHTLPDTAGRLNQPADRLDCYDDQGNGTVAPAVRD